MLLGEANYSFQNTRVTIRSYTVGTKVLHYAYVANYTYVANT